jgi:ankyrin repeat protein
MFLQGSVMAVEFLILNGAKINAQDADGKTPLHIATVLGEIYVLFGFKRILLLLLCFASGCYNRLFIHRIAACLSATCSSLSSSYSSVSQLF